MALLHRQFLFAIACALAWTQAHSYTYRCLTDETPDTAIAQYELIRLYQPMPGCSGRRKYCTHVILLFPDRNTLASEVLLLTADLSVCDGALEIIKRAIKNPENRSTGLTFSKIETYCSGVNSKMMTRWLQKKYVFRALAQCIDNICTDIRQLKSWQHDQRTYCYRFLRE